MPTYYGWAPLPADEMSESVKFAIREELFGSVCVGLSYKFVDRPVRNRVISNCTLIGSVPRPIGAERRYSVN